MSQPNLLLVPFGSSAAAGTIEPIPTARGAGDPPQKATWNEGFPSVTMTPLAAGGIPPKGQDFNGVLKAISEHTAFLCGGGIYKWNAAVVSVSGGYAKGAIVQSDDGLSAYVSAIDGNTINFNSTPASIGNQWLVWTGNAKANASVTISAGTGLSGGGSLAANRTLSVVYGTAAGTSAQGNDSRIVGAAQKSANLSDLSSASAARSNLGLGTAATAAVMTSATDATAGALQSNGSWGIGSTAQVPGFLDFKTDIPVGIYRGAFSTVSNGPISSAVGFTAIPMRYSSTFIIWLVTSIGRSWTGEYNITTGVITWTENYNTSNVSAFSQTLLSLTNAADGRTKLGVVDGVGINQTSQDLTASRAVNTTYTNSTGRPILVCIYCAMAPNASGSLNVSGVDVVPLFTSSSTSIASIVSYVIPAGATYRLNATSLTRWTELR